VFYVRADLSVGSYSIIKDLGSNAQRDYMINVDVEELASTSYRIDAYAREDVTDGWGDPLNGTGSEAVETSCWFQIQGTFRYVRVDVTTTGDVFESGVVGY
jgi:hypothetical protein